MLKHDTQGAKSSVFFSLQTFSFIETITFKVSFNKVKTVCSGQQILVSELVTTPQQTSNIIHPYLHAIFLTYMVKKSA